MDPDHEVCRDDGGARNGQPPAQAPDRWSRRDQRRGCGRSGGGHPPSDAKRSEGHHQRREAPRLWGEGRAKGGKAKRPKGGKGRPRKGGLDRVAMPQSRFGFCPGNATIFPFAEFWSTFSTALRIQCAGAVGDFPDCSPFAAILFPRQTDRGRRHLLARSDAHGRVACFGWGPTGCKKAPLYDFLMSEGRRVWRLVLRSLGEGGSRRAEGIGPFSFSPVPKGGASLRAKSLSENL